MKVARGNVMYSAAGLDYWEIITYSGVFALFMLGIASLIGFAIAGLVFREPARMRGHVPVPGTSRPEAKVEESPRGQPGWIVG
jgi:hypothetical protein